MFAALNSLLLTSSNLMAHAYVFPGQGAQFVGMGKELFESSAHAKQRFQEAEEVLGIDLMRLMFEGPQEELTLTSVTQPAIYVHSVVLAEVMGVQPAIEMAAGHSLGEFSALAAVGALGFADGLALVQARANAMQAACDAEPSTMAAIIGLEDEAVEQLCAAVAGIVVPANYNSPGQLVISGQTAAVKAAVTKAQEAGARLAKVLEVNGAFHSPLMESARQELATAIEKTSFKAPKAPVYQNVTASGTTDPDVLRENLVKQLTAPVRWTQSVQQMIADGATLFTELGPGKVLQGLVKRIDRSLATEGFQAP